MSNIQDGPDGDPAARNPREARAPRPAGPPASSRGGLRNDSAGTGNAPQERYWTDYLRVALPVLGLLVLVGLLWYWASAIIGDNSAEAPLEPSAIAMVTPVVPATPPPAAVATLPVVALTPGLPAPTIDPAAVPTVQPIIIAPTEPPAAVAPAEEPAPVADAANPCSGMPTYDIGGAVVTTEEVNLRDAPSTEGVAIRVLPAGTALTVDGDFIEAGQCDWWPVTVVDSGETGFVIEQYLGME